MMSWRIHSVTSLVAILSLAIIAASALAQSSVSPEQEKLARQHLKALCEHIDSLRFGAYSFELKRGPQGEEPKVTAGHFQFDFDRDLASCNLLDRASCPTFWSRDWDAQYLVHNTHARAGVIIYPRDKDHGFHQADPLFDIREIPFMNSGCLIVPRVLPYLSPTPYLVNHPITSFREVGDLVEITIKTSNDVKENFERLPEKARTTIAKLVEEKGASSSELPIRRRMTIYQFDREQHGLLKHSQSFTSTFGEENWIPISRSQVEWTKFGDQWVPAEAKATFELDRKNVPPTEVHLTIDWQQVNENRDKLDFRPEAVKQLHGRDLTDSRYPDPKLVGVVGDGQERTPPPKNAN